ncbi:ABC transporter substrate-binding protein [Thermogladius calderae]|nr:helical backbone metal receptor [Thermogladius calderae]
MSKQEKALLLLVFTALALYHVTELSAVSHASTLTITDALGRVVNLTRTPQRVVSLSPSITETLLALNLSNEIVGVDHYSYSDWFMNASSQFQSRNVTDVGGYWWSAISIEKILSLQPGLVLADAGAHRPLLNTFVEYNLTVVYLKGGSATSIEDVYSDIYTIGLIFNRTGEATKLINNIEAQLNEGKRLLSGYAGLSVLYVVGIYQGIWVAGKSTYFNDLVSRLGLKNAAGSYGWRAVSIEDIAAWRPDVVIVASMGVTREDVEKSGLASLGAKVVYLNSTETDILSRPSPLVALVPSVLYDALSKAVPLPTTTTTPQTATVTYTETKTETSTFTMTITIEKTTYQSSWVLALVVSSLVIAFAAGLLTGRRTKKG